MGIGVTDPLLMKTTDDLYIVKTLDDKEQPKVLINEFVCYKLAKLLELPIPDASLMKISQEVIDASFELQQLGVVPGIHFGSKFVNRSNTVITPPILNMITNKEDIPSIILFDQIIYNDDRTVNKGNLLFDLKAKALLIIDHSHVFRLGAIWDAGELKKIHEVPLCLVKEFHGQNYRFLLKYVNGYNPFNKILQKVANISQEDIDWCLEGIPEQWELSLVDKNALKEFLLYRIDNVHKFLELLSNQCPSWKGGDYNAS